MKYLLLYIGIAVALAIALTACRAPECKQMTRCCEAVEDLEGLGASCAGLADDTSDPMTCRDVVRTIGYMLEDRDKAIPESCQL